ncbi:MAG: BatD family protein [Sulfurimonas sp.]
MKNLGKFIILLIFMSVSSLYASVVAKVEPSTLYRGDTARLVLTIEGREVNKPILDNICGNDILSSASQTSITMVNTEYKKSYVLSYTFAPQKSCTVEPISVEVDGKIEKSNPVTVTVKPASQNKDANFIITLIPSKKEVLVGEPFWITLELKQNKSAEVVDSKFIAPDFNGFWIKGESPTTREEKGNYIITKMKYKLAAQRVGDLSIKPAQLRIASRVNRRDMWGSFMPQIEWKNYFSNELVIHAKPLPGNVKLVGEFTISAVADKTKITKNEAVNVTVQVTGEGNLEDIESFKPSIPGVNVFAEKIKIKGKTLTQKLAFVSDKDFTIPSFSLRFYNLNTKKIEHAETKPISITVEGSNENSTALAIQKSTPNADEEEIVKVKTTENTSHISYGWLGGMFVLGAFFGALLMYVALRFMPSFSAEKKRRFSPKDEKQLLIRLLPYKDEDSDVAALIEVLEGNLYEGKKEPLDKKLLKSVLERHKIG